MVMAGLLVYFVMVLGSMATMSVGAGILGVSLVSALLWPKSRFLIKTAAHELAASKIFMKWLGATMFLVLAIIGSLISAHFFPLQFSGELQHVDWVHSLGKIWYLFWPGILAVLLLSGTETQRERVASVYWGTAAFISCVGILQFFTGWPRPQGIPGWDGRFHATLFLGHHLSTASILIFPFFWGLERGLLGPRRMKWALGTVVIGTCLILSFSRMLWISLPVGMVLWALLRLPKKYWLGVGAAFVLILGVAFSRPEVRGRFEMKMGQTERFQIWSVNWHFFELRPLLGVGFRQSEPLSGRYLREATGKTDVFAGHAHNNFLEMLSSTGILGLVAWLLLNGILLSAAPSPAAIAAFLVFHLNGLTQVNFWEGKVLHHFSIWAAWVLVSHVTKRRDNVHS